MTAPTSVFSAADQATLLSAAETAAELLSAAGRSGDARLVHAAAGCRPGTDTLARALPVLRELRDRCARESDPNFWLDRIGADADGLSDAQGLVQSLIDSRQGQSRVLAAAVGACERAIASSA